METCEEGSSATFECIHGEVMKMTTTGASTKTALPEHFTVFGVEASHLMAKVDLKRINRFKPLIMKVASDKKVDPAVIAGIISRETRGGLFQPGLPEGWGDNGNAFGLMQVDQRYYSPEGSWDSIEHIIQATDILVKFTKKIQEKFPDWSMEDQFKGGIAAYNAGAGHVCSLECLDLKTTGSDYANDVVARAQWFKLNGY